MLREKPVLTVDDKPGHFEPLAKSVPKLFTQKIQEASKRGEILPEDPAQLLVTLIGSCLYFYVGFPILSNMFPRMREQREQFILERKEHLFRILYYGLKPRPESNV